MHMHKCYHFSQSAIVIIFMLSFSLVHILCYHLCYQGFKNDNIDTMKNYNILYT
jgi:hypothetical protein